MDLARVESVIGSDAIFKLKNSHVVVVGLGGVGSYIAEGLARSGVGHLTLIDGDKIASSNINRQIPALLSTMGKLKTEVMRERIFDINSECMVTTHSSFYGAGDFEKFFSKKIDYVADAIDSLAAKADILTCCVLEKIPVISSMGMCNKLCPEYLKLADISETHTCPLARNLRKSLRIQGVYRGITVVYSREEPKIKSRTTGSMVFVPASAGILMASFIVRQLIK
ncbi:MAG: tRNA threonylcarbamoyladenosine dehydratase [Phascolarctobacterium sp.]|nr:tRNA threonylcarbamoyladenosine dehydratase [Phascolarctobacterium sp.]